MQFTQALLLAALAAPSALAAPHRRDYVQGPVYWQGKEMPADNGGNVAYHYTTVVKTVTLRPGQQVPGQSEEPKTKAFNEGAVFHQRPKTRTRPAQAVEPTTTAAPASTVVVKPIPAEAQNDDENDTPDYLPTPSDVESEVVAATPTPTTTPAPVVVKPSSTTEEAVQSTQEASGNEDSSSGSSEGLPADGLKSGSSDDLTEQEYADICVYHHNIHRRDHGSPDVKWSAEIAKLAQQAADTCDGSHSTPSSYGSYGSNLAGTQLSGNSPGDDGSKTPNPSGMISDMWYWGEIDKFPGWGLEKSAYEYTTADGQEGFYEWGHMTAMLWPDTAEIGCATSHCSNGWYGLCMYSPQGNMNGDYGVIGAPKGDDKTKGNGDN